MKKKKSYLWVDPFDEATPEKIKEFLIEQVKLKSRQIILNVAGNRESKNTGIENKVKEVLKEVLCQP